MRIYTKHRLNILRWTISTAHKGDQISGVYILQNTKVVGGGNGCWGKKMKTVGAGKKMKKGKGEKEKGEKRLKKASLRVKNSKIFTGGGATAPPCNPPAAGRGFAHAGALGKKNYVLKVGGGNDHNV